MVRSSSTLGSFLGGGGMAPVVGAAARRDRVGRMRVEVAVAQLGVTLRLELALALGGGDVPRHRAVGEDDPVVAADQLCERRPRRLPLGSGGDEGVQRFVFSLVERAA